MGNKVLTLKDKKRLGAWFMSDDGRLFMDTIKDMDENHMNLARNMYLKVINPNEQIAVQVNQAMGIHEVIEFIESVCREVKESEKEAEDQSEL